MLVVVILIVLVVVTTGTFYFLSKKEVKENITPQVSEEELQTPDLGNLAPEVNVGVAVENPLENMPSTNPLEDIPNPFDNNYENPFE